MTKKQIAAQILQAENTLKELREKLNRPKPIESFKLGDVFNCGANVPLIVAKIWNGDSLYHVIGNDSGGRNYLRAYSDCENGFSESQMLDYLNKKVESGWKYVGNISEQFDNLVREMLEK